jgi:hypothetical protein
MSDILIRFRLFGNEAEAFRKLSSKEFRSPREQAHYIIRQELARRGLLPADSQPPLSGEVTAP